MRRSTSCKDPCVGVLQAQFIKVNHGLDYRTLFLGSDWTEANIDSKFQQLLNLSKTYSECKNTMIKGDYPIMLRSSCPWTIAKEVQNEGIFPREIVYAKKSCPMCIIGSNIGCDPINYKIKILVRTGCFNGVNIYTEKTQVLPIAHVCSQNREKVSVGSISTHPKFPSPI